VVRNTSMRQQSGEHWDQMEDMDYDEDDVGAEGEEHNSEDHEGADGEEDDSEDDVAEGELDSQMPQERQTIVIDISLLCFSYLEDYQTQ